MSSVEESTSASFAALGVSESIVAAIEERGFTSPTAVQSALLDPKLAGRDVLVSSQTGSGKTVAFGLLVAPSLTPGGERTRGTCTPAAVVIAPTRELAQQVRTELAWLLAPMRARVVAVTGGTSVVGELRDLSMGADVVVGTPGRLNDHLTRGSVDPSRVATLVLDEADEMLDMGFRDELEAILQTMPAQRRTVMLSATMPAPIVALAGKYLRDALRVAIDPPGSANRDIAHVLYGVHAAQRFDALVNILLVAAEERTLVFTRTRADAADVGERLASLGFAAAALTGEMAQRDRTQTLDAFRSGRVNTLVATDVAARGIDVPEVSRVVHYDLPSDGATFTHRAGRTGRAGRKGTSVALVPPFARGRATELMRTAGARNTATWARVPGAAEVRAAGEARLRERLAAGGASVEANRELASTLVAERDPVEIVAWLLGETRWQGPCDAREVAQLSEQRDRPRQDFRGGEATGAFSRGGHVMFRVNFGERHGATPSRLLAMVCRRGGVRGGDVGAISIGSEGSTFGVSPQVAQSFASSASRRDTREPNVHIERMAGAGGAGGDADRAGPPSHRPAPRRWDDRAAEAHPARPRFVPREGAVIRERAPEAQAAAPTGERAPWSPGPRPAKSAYTKRKPVRPA